MNFGNLKIGVRLALLGAFFLLALLTVGYQGWSAISSIKANNARSMQRSVDLTQAVDTARGAQVEFKIQVQEWKNILIRGHDQAQFDKYSAAFLKSSQATNAELKKLGGLFSKLNLQTNLDDEAIKMHEDLGKNYMAALKQFDQSNPDSYKVVDKAVSGMDRPPTKKIDEIVEFIDAQSKKNVTEAAAAADATARSATITLLVVLVVTTAVGAAIVWWIVKGITRPLDQAIDIAKTVAAGDLSREVEVKTTDEVGELLGALKQMSGNLSDIVSRVRVGTETIASASSQVATGSMDLSTRTEEQASSLEETASSMTELTSTVRQNNENATQARKLADEASNVAVRGGTTVSEVVQTMGAINESSRKIVDIIGVIDGIAFQTNILALNAAVEAARAGEQGRGFAVVAGEVRNLAHRSAAAAKEIKELIGNSVERVEEGSRLVGEAGVTMEEVVNSVRRVTSIIGEIAVATGEQREGIEQISDAITQMDTVTQQNAALVEEAAAAAEALQQQAASLTEAVSFFKVREPVGAGRPMLSASRSLRTLPA